MYDNHSYNRIGIQKWTLPNQALMVELNWLHLTNKNAVTWNNAKNIITMSSKYVKVNEDEYFDDIYYSIIYIYIIL